MDIVANPGTVLRRVIIAKYMQLLQLSTCNLCNLRHQVIGDPVGIFPQQAAGMGPDGIEVAQQSDAPLRV